jgi:hypothetical protein
MTRPITEADLLATGYKRCRIPLIDLADRFYQKSIVLEDGAVKYLTHGRN